MLLNAVILILREVLEAAMIVSIFLALVRQYQIPMRSLWWMPIFSLVGLVAYVGNIELITDALDGVGQEILNATLQFIIYLLILFISVLLFVPKWRQHVGGLMFFALTIAIIREGSEVALYLQGFILSPTGFLPVLMGSLIGLGIGVSVGVLIYYFLVSQNKTYFPIFSFTLLFLTAGGMIMQATQLLIQADWLPSQKAIWDSSGFISEHSMIGQLLYALLGYESTPSMIQIACYLASILFLSGLTGWAYQNSKESA